MGWNEVLATGFTVFTIILLVCAVMDHHWILVETKMQNYYSGIWKVCIKQVCSDLIAASPNVYGARTLLVLALFCGIVGASFMTFTYRYSSPFTIYRYLVAAMGSLIAAALVFLALSIYTIRISTHSISRTGNITYLWSFYMAWTSCPSFILSGLFSLMAHQRLLVHGSSFSDGESSTITSSSSEWTSSSSSYLENSEEERKMSVSARRSLHK
ncbi:domain-containing 2-like [Podarcis lilfordi]|uniref:Domain-containing 2-like n=1 Tax=Podarcis lilfordi TaxID=74358 RepID=A0AA35PDY4_9SAUR|nr:domain-containing 2-like [Podarcis lilfordi]